MSVTQVSLIRQNWFFCKFVKIFDFLKWAWLISSLFRLTKLYASSLRTCRACQNGATYDVYKNNKASQVCDLQGFA